MLTLVNAQVWKYKSIEDSTPVDIAKDVTVLVGKNESGKTGFLEALHKALPLGDSKYNFVEDYPRKEMFSYRKRHKAEDFSKVTQLTFRIEKKLADEINKLLFNSEEIVKLQSTFTRTTNMANQHMVVLPFDEAAALKALSKPFLQTEIGAQVFNQATTLPAVIESIEALGLPAEDALAQFAASWKKRKELFPAWSHVGGFLWHGYVLPALPQFLYFDDYRLLSGKINLPSLQSRIANKQITEAD